MTNRIRFALCFIICFIVLNPVFHALNIKGSVLLLVLVFLTVLSNQKLVIKKPQIFTYALGAIYLFTAALTAVYNMDSTPFVYAVFFLVTFFTVLQTSYETAVRFVQLGTQMFVIFIILAMIGALYYYAGGNPILTLVNPDGRNNSLYLTTFSNAADFFIRPSAIYDEPGAFSFYICIIVALRSLLGMSNRISGLLLLGGVITLSIAHVIFSVIWAVWAVMSNRTKKINIKGILILASFLFLVWFIYQSGTLDWTFSRAIEFYENPWMNPRQRAFDEVIQGLEGSLNHLWFGFDADCIARKDNCNDFGENPLTPLIYGGLLAAWPYYAFLLIAFTSPIFSRYGFIYAGIGVLLLQRPYFLEFPYSATMALMLVVATGAIKPRRRKSEACLKADLYPVYPYDRLEISRN